MRDIYQEFEEVCFEISKINDISSTILDAMKNCLTENKSTYHLLTNLEMLNEKTFAMMQDGVLLVNTARGPLVDEKALIEALNSGKVGGAALDVMTGETKIFNQQIDFQEVDYNEFKDLVDRPNVLITPHIAFYTDQAIKNMVKMSLSANLDLIKTGTSDKLVKF